MFTQTVTLREFMIANKAKKVELKFNKSTKKTFGVIGEETTLLSKKVKEINAENFNELSVSFFESEDGEVQGWMIHPAGGAETVCEFSLEEVPEFKA